VRAGRRVHQRPLAGFRIGIIGTGMIDCVQVTYNIFTRQITDLFSDEEHLGFQSRIAANPALGPIIRGGGGISKVRVAVGSRGRRSGARVIYYWAVRRDVILLLYAYPKSEAVDLTQKQISQLAAIVKEEFGSEKSNV